MRRLIQLYRDFKTWRWEQNEYKKINNTLKYLYLAEVSQLDCLKAVYEWRMFPRWMIGDVALMLWYRSSRGSTTLDEVKLILQERQHDEM